MEKFDKILSVVSVAIVLFVVLIACIDNFIYKKELPNSAYCRESGKCAKTYIYERNYIYNLDLDDYGRYNKNNTKLKNPIVVFGGTFAYGYYELEKSFSYILSKVTKRNVADRTLIGSGLQSMYFQSTNPEFYKIIPNSKDVIYVLAMDDITNTLIPTSYCVSEISFKLHYYVKDGELIMSDYNNRFLNFFRSIYLIKLINRKYVDYYISKAKNWDKISDLVTLYFKESKEALNNNWKSDINFTVVINNDIKYRDKIAKKLQDAGINVVNSDYNIKDKELDWNKVMPLIKKELSK